MEEIQSTAVLDREILEDARKKAKKEHDAADAAAAAAFAQWAEKAEAEASALEVDNQGKIESQRVELFSRLALDQRRIRAERSEATLKGALDRWKSELPRSEVLSVLSSELSSLVGELPTASLEVRSMGLSESELYSLLTGTSQGALLQGATLRCEGLDEPFPSLSIEAPGLRLRVSFAELCERALLDHRAELVGALLGPEAIND